MSATAQPLDLLTVPLRGAHLIEASAGTGKTYTIANLYLRILLECAWTVQNILVVTFTKAATAELRGRIRDRIQAALDTLDGSESTGNGSDETLLTVLKRCRNAPHARQRLRDALICMDEAAIFTIHGLCQRLLQEHAFESGILFETDFVGNQQDLLAAVIEDFWRETFYGASSGLARLAQRTWKEPERLLDEIEPHLAREDVLLMPPIHESDVAPAVYRRLLEFVRGLWAENRAGILDGLQKLIDGKDLSRADGNYQPEPLREADAALDAYLRSEIDDYFLPAGFELFTHHKFKGSLNKQGLKRAVEPPFPEFFEACQELQDLCRRKIIQLRTAAFDYCRSALVPLKNSKKLLSYDDLIQRLNHALLGEGGEHLSQAIAAQFPVALIDEFQDTDPGQYAIFSRTYRDRPDTGLFMIGDPKQAIYSFRGGDIFTYMRARRITASHYTLDTCWRSTSAYMQALNKLFRQEKQPFIYSADIPYYEVHASLAGKANREPLLIAGNAPPPFCAWFVQRTPDNTWHRSVQKEWARVTIARACAEEIERLLDAQREVRIGGRVLEPRDVAILVRTHREARIVLNALQEHGIASVYLGRRSIYGSAEATELARILTAVAEPQSDRSLRAALATEILGKTAEWLAADEDERWDEVFQAFRAYYEEWRRHGFIAMFRTLLHEQDVPARLMRYPDGERRLTNLLQLGELLQGASQEQQGMEGLLRWFADSRRRPDDDSEDQQLRLESDAERVQIVTIYKSKGLEYAIVFLPYIWDSRPRGAKGRPFSFHDEAQAEMPLVFDLAGQEENLPRADKERLAEELRLLYVAATRAKYRCYLAWGNISGAKNSALGYLLHQDQTMSDPVSEIPERIGKATDEELLADLQALNRGEALFEIAGLPPSGSMGGKREASAEGMLTARTFRASIDANWRIASFTALAAARQDVIDSASLAEPDFDLRIASQDTVTESVPAPDSIFAFPKGARTGIFLHELFELMDFPSAVGSELCDSLTRLLRKHAYPVELWRPAVTRLVTQVLDTVLNADQGLSLRAIGGARRVNELKFYYPLATLRAAGLNELLRGFAAYADDPPSFDFDETRGMMHGFIDLVFEHDGRYFLLDYKSNHLGNRIEDYARDRLRSVVRAHRYDLQYLIYTVAVHRYLRHRLPGYSYREHFGGVYYLFLRGMDAQRGADFGVFYDQPEQALLERLDALLVEDQKQEEA